MYSCSRVICTFRFLSKYFLSIRRRIIPHPQIHTLIISSLHNFLNPQAFIINSSMNSVTKNGGRTHVYSLPFSSNRTRKQAKSTPAKASSRKVEIRVCTNRTCRKQGSLDALQVLSGIAPPYVAVNSCGCLGRCGSGPNIVVLPEGAFMGHCGTPSKAAYAMSVVCGADDAAAAGKKCLEALALRKRAEDEMARGDSVRAFSLLSQAIDLKPIGGVHIMYKGRSEARLAMGDIIGALEDVKEALALAPYYSEAYICEGDVFMAMDRFDEAKESYSISLELDPSIRRSKSFKARIAKLHEKLTPANTS